MIDDMCNPDLIKKADKVATWICNDYDIDYDKFCTLSDDDIYTIINSFKHSCVGGNAFKNMVYLSIVERFDF